MEKVHAICAVIRERGLSNCAAGAEVGVPHTTLSRWKAQYEEAEVELGKARALYQVPRLHQMAQTRCKDGSLDWRAQAWLMKFSSPGTYGSPSRRRRLRDVEIHVEDGSANAGDDLAETTRGATANSVTFLPETPVENAAARQVEEDATQSVTFLPEIPVENATPLPNGAEGANSVTLSPETPAEAEPDGTGSVTFLPEIPAEASLSARHSPSALLHDQAAPRDAVAAPSAPLNERRLLERPRCARFHASSSPGVSRVASHPRRVHSIKAGSMSKSAD